MELRARSLWLLTEPLHAVCYFDDKCRDLGKDLGLKGFWMGYFASRTAPLGAVEPAAATAVLGVFAPGMVARALPAAWSVTSPAHILDERGSRAAHALRGIAPELEHAAADMLPPLQTIVDAAPATARPLFAANRVLCDHADPVERLWQLVTTLREFRGDAHLAVLADEGLDGCEALVLAAASGRVPRDTMRQDRGWSEEEWSAAADRLRSRGLVDAQGDATEHGRQERSASRRRPTGWPADCCIHCPRRRPNACCTRWNPWSGASWPRTCCPSPTRSVCRTSTSPRRAAPTPANPAAFRPP